MNWTNFLLLLTLIYLTYYGLNILYDLFRTQKPPKEKGTEELLFFEDDIPPQLIVPAELSLDDVDDLANQSIDIELDHQELTFTDTFEDESVNFIQSTGAVELQELYNLAKANLIEYTGAISY